ncbi:hypothetical protein TGAM01_v210980 [Trichoderma gamsii]|uniref:Uncharacterized protein n=1 Tax=Trichoderma gamsii TaxID=398673 RepID=A0A2P4Z794_9HYPO|nr:hypothetical protein TGAM01_v210980 [Trichoderma gamsii]PON20158.1 hypothetical protein TGAM01_v210980 [Trichoderma gamsii]
MPWGVSYRNFTVTVLAYKDLAVSSGASSFHVVAGTCTQPDSITVLLYLSRYTRHIKKAWATSQTVCERRKQGKISSLNALENSFRPLNQRMEISDFKSTTPNQ